MFYAYFIFLQQLCDCVAMFVGNYFIQSINRQFKEFSLLVVSSTYYTKVVTTLIFFMLDVIIKYVLYSKLNNHYSFHYCSN